MRRRIRLHVDKVVLDGATPRDRAAFERALAQSLADGLGRAAASDGLSDLASSRSLDGGRLGKPTDASALGARIVARLTGGRS